MGGKQMEGDNRERRKKAKEARDEGKKPSESGATLGASHQHKDSHRGDNHEDQLRQMHEGKTPSATKGETTVSTRSRNREEGSGGA